MAAPALPVCVGIDSSDTTHVVHASDGTHVRRFRVANDAQGMAELLTQVRQSWPEQPLAFGVENPTSLLALALLARGEAVYSTNPYAVLHLRQGLNPSGKKDDPEDARAICLYLRENLTKLQPIRASSDDGTLLQARVLERLDLVRQKTRLLNQLTALLKSTYPAALAVFGKLDQDLTLAFLERWPTADHLATLTRAEFETFLQERRYPRPRQVAALWLKLQVPQPALPAHTVRLQEGPCRRLLAQLQLLRAQIQAVEAEITELFTGHPDHELFASLPGAGPLLAPGLLAVLGDNREVWESVAHLAAHSGTVPVTQQSGRQRSVQMRHRCDKDRRYLLHLFADASRRTCPWAAAFYAEQRAKGIAHATALRNLATKWLRILWRMWHDGEKYDSERVGQRRREGLTATATAPSP